MSHSEPQREKPGQRQWPQDGDQWSDPEPEDGADMDCGLLLAMAEEDEDINVYNAETFGIDIDALVTDESHYSLQFGAAPPPTPPPSGPRPGASFCRPTSLPKHKTHYPPKVPLWQRGRARGPRGELSLGQIFEDPAVMTTVQGSLSLKSLDSAIVDCGYIVHRNAFEDMKPLANTKTRTMPGCVHQDSGIMCMVGHRDKGQPTNSSFLDRSCPASSFGSRRGEPRGSFSRRPFGQRGASQVPAPVLPGSPVFQRQPLTPRQCYNQTGRFRFPQNRQCTSTPSPMTPKMMQLRFGTNSPRPSGFYSPSTHPMQHVSRFPGPMTQLHPQHKRLLSHKQCIFQRKSDCWDSSCNLMTAKEKKWIIRLQMIQLQTENPYLEDYYYQEYYRRMEAKMAEEELGIRSKREPPKLTTPYITKTDVYTPVVHFEGSLGQVAVSTCYSPRRAIGAVHAVQAQSPVDEQKDTKQQRLEVLSKIEKMFVLLLEVEESERMKTTVLTEVEEKLLMQKAQREVALIFSQLQHHNLPNSGGEFLPFLLVSKGKKLLARLLPFLNQEPAMKILRIVTHNLPTLMSRDAEEVLPVLYPPLRSVIGTLKFSQLIVVLKDLMTSESLPTSECLTLTCQNRFGLSLLYALLSHGEKLLSSSVPLEPCIGDFETWTETVFQVASQLSQSSLVEPLLLPSNLLTLFCRYLDKHTVYQLRNNMESATGYVALPS